MLPARACRLALRRGGYGILCFLSDRRNQRAKKIGDGFIGKINVYRRFYRPDPPDCSHCYQR